MADGKHAECARGPAVRPSANGRRKVPASRIAAAVGVVIAVGIGVSACSEGVRYPSIADISPITIPVLTPSQQAKAVSELEAIRETHGSQTVKAISAPSS
ncbi:MAG: hypothetical protein GC150_07280 [Rhizobiales bacterium]|nr:hypothetical protein [Hyphomicrobiales bacterium]